MAKLFANSEEPDQTLHFAASDLGLHFIGSGQEADGDNLGKSFQSSIR